MSTTASQDQHSQSSEADDNRPLSQDEFQLLQRLLSDPFSFPLPFKTWLVSYLEASDMELPISSIHGLSARLPAATTFEARLAALEARVTALEP